MWHLHGAARGYGLGAATASVTLACPSGWSQPEGENPPIQTSSGDVWKLYLGTLPQASVIEKYLLEEASIIAQYFDYFNLPPTIIILI